MSYHPCPSFCIHPGQLAEYSLFSISRVILKTCYHGITIFSTWALRLIEKLHSCCPLLLVRGWHLSIEVLEWLSQYLKMKRVSDGALGKLAVASDVSRILRLQKFSILKFHDRALKRATSLIALS